MVEILFARKGDIQDIEDALANSHFVVTQVTGDLGNEQVLSDSSTIKVDASTPGTLYLVRAALTGDVTAAQDSNSLLIAVDTVDNTKLANMVEATFKMRAAGSGTGDPIDGTATQAKTALAITAADVSGGAALTKADDTNVTLTLGGTPTQALLRATSITVGWTGTLAAARLNANVVQAVTNDTNVTGSIGTQTITLGWTGTLAAARLNSAVVQAVTNDTNINGSISAQNLTFSWAGTLAVSRGGLGVGTVTGLMQGNGTSAVTTVANSSTTGQALRVTGAATYGWGAIDLANSSAVTGLLPNANLANMVQSTFKMRAAGAGTGVPIDGTVAQAKTALGYVASDIGSGAALTKADDTNVTLTLGGSPTAALLAASSLTLGWTGTLAVSRGGTGGGSLTNHGVLLGQSTSAVVATAAGTAGQVLKSGGASADPAFADDQVAFGITLQNGGAVLTTGIKGDISIPFACVITGVRLLADQSGSIVVDIWKDTYANYPPVVGDSITASAKPTLSTATKSEDTTLTSWTTSVAAGDTLRFNIDSVSTVTRVLLTLKARRT